MVEADQEIPQPQSSYFWTYLAIAYFIVQAAIGIYLFELAWSTSIQYRRKTQEKIHSKYPMFRRLDNPQNWSKLSFYPGAIFVLTTRFVALFGIFFTCCSIINIACIGHDFDKGPIKGIRRKIKYYVTDFCVKSVVIIAGMRVNVVHKKVDYSEYLGPNYQVFMKKFNRVSTVIVNHVSWLDGFIFLSFWQTGLAPDSGFAQVPIMGTTLKTCDSIFIPRGKSEEDKQKALQHLKERQEAIEEKGEYAPFLIFPEGTTSNGTHLLGFKRGAFDAEKRIQPIYLKYTFKGFSSDYSIIDRLPLCILTLSWIWGGLDCELGVMPIFQPNEHMYKEYESKGSERWQVYAWCVRDAMAKAGGFKVTDIPVRAKLAYYYKLNGRLEDLKDFENKSIDQIVKDYEYISSKKKV